MYKLLITILLLSILPVQAKHLYKESVYQDYWCNKRGGILEYELNDKSRVDCLLPDMAVEFDFARKRDECILFKNEYAKKLIFRVTDFGIYFFLL